MCFHISNKNPNEQTAKEDIVVYKVLERKSNKAIYRNFYYQPNRTYRLRKKLELCHSSFISTISNIHEGFHSCSTLDKAKEIKSYDWNYRKIVKFIIPKGAKYYYNQIDQEYVSTSIRMK